jgi:hypothetical protein
MPRPRRQRPSDKPLQREQFEPEYVDIDLDHPSGPDRCRLTVLAFIVFSLVQPGGATASTSVSSSGVLSSTSVSASSASASASNAIGSSTIIRASVSASGSGSASAAQPSSTAYPTIPFGAVYADPPGAGQRLHPAGRDDLCVTVMNGYPQSGEEVAPSSVVFRPPGPFVLRLSPFRPSVLSPFRPFPFSSVVQSLRVPREPSDPHRTYCLSNSDSNTCLQLWSLPTNTSGPVTLHDNDGLCLDAGDNPADGSAVKIWTCYDGLDQQTWIRSATNTLSLSNSELRSSVGPGVGVADRRNTVLAQYTSHRVTLIPARPVPGRHGRFDQHQRGAV